MTSGITQRFTNLPKKFSYQIGRLFQLPPHTTQTLGTNQRLPMSWDSLVQLGKAFLSSVSIPGMPDILCWPLQNLGLAPSVMGYTNGFSALICSLGIETLPMGTKVPSLYEFPSPQYHQSNLRVPRQVRERTGGSN